MEELKHYADEACHAAEMQSQDVLARETALQATVQDLTAARAADASGHAVSLQEVRGVDRLVVSFCAFLNPSRLEPR